MNTTAHLNTSDRTPMTATRKAALIAGIYMIVKGFKPATINHQTSTPASSPSLATVSA